MTRTILLGIVLFAVSGQAASPLASLAGFHKPTIQFSDQGEGQDKRSKKCPDGHGQDDGHDCRVNKG
jgi:hypothetical protein